MVRTVNSRVLAVPPNEDVSVAKVMALRRSRESDDNAQLI